MSTRSSQKKKAVPIVMSRWLTTASRILRLYVSTNNPEEALRWLAQYVSKVYARVWFQIKLNPSCTNGARHLWLLARSASFLPEGLRSIVHAVISSNAYFVHPENLLLVMITDWSKDIRVFGWWRIRKSRQKKRSSLREFVVPKVNFDANEYYEMIDRFSMDVTEPPLTRELPSGQIEENIRTSAIASEQICSFPCHTQAVERIIKVVTEAAASVYGTNQRDGFIRAKLESRRKMPKFDSKQDYDM